MERAAFFPIATSTQLSRCPVLGEDRKWSPTAVMTRLTHIGSQPLRNDAPVVSSFGHPSVPDIRRSSCGPDASWIDISVRGDVVDLTARDADIVEISVTQVEQPGSYPLAFVPFEKGSAAIAEQAQAGSNRRERLSRPGTLSVVSI